MVFFPVARLPIARSFYKSSLLMEVAHMINISFDHFHYNNAVYKRIPSIPSLFKPLCIDFNSMLRVSK